MPFASNRGQRIHYTVDGSGPLVVLQHALLMDAECWTQSGFVDALTDGFRVACVDSLGHGRSDKPSDPELYDQEQRAGDIIAVIDGILDGGMAFGRRGQVPSKAPVVAGARRLGRGQRPPPRAQEAFELQDLHGVCREDGADAGRMGDP